MDAVMIGAGHGAATMIRQLLARTDTAGRKQPARVV